MAIVIEYFNRLLKKSVVEKFIKGISFNAGLKSIKWLCLLNFLEGYSRAEEPYVWKIADLLLM